MPFLQSVGVKGREELIINITSHVSLSALNMYSAQMQRILVSTSNNIPQQTQTSFAMQGITVSTSNTTPIQNARGISIGPITASNVTSIVASPVTMNANIGSLTMSSTVL